MVTAKIMHEGSGFALTEAEISVRRQDRLQRRHHVPRGRFPEGRIPRQHARGRRGASRFPMETRGPWLTPRARSLDHRHRHRVLPRRRAGRALAGARRRPSAGRRDDLSALHHPQARAARLRQADPEEGRPAPDGGVAAHRHLCGRACARIRRRQRQRRNPGAHRHDRRGRRRRARHRGRHRDPVRACTAPRSRTRSSTSG